MSNLHELDLRELRTVTGRYGETQEVNALLHDGWILINTYVESFLFDEERKVFSQRPCYVLGRARVAPSAPSMKTSKSRALEEEIINAALEIDDEDDPI